MNALDTRGNSPLLSLCDLSTSEIYDYLEDLSPSSSDTLEDTSANLCIKGEFLNYLLLQKDLQVSIALVIIELLGRCKGGNFNIHIWVWFGYFICSRREIRVCLFGKELVNCLSHAKLCAIHENCDHRIYAELTFIISRRSRRDIVLASSVHSVRPHFLSVRNHISVPIGQI